MPNLSFSVDESSTVSFEVKLQAVSAELQSAIKLAVFRSGAEALDVMQKQIPSSDRGSGRFKHYKGPDEPRVKDFLEQTAVVYAPGGFGGGGNFRSEVGLSVNAPPHYRAILEGVPDLNLKTGQGATGRNLGPMSIRGSFASASGAGRDPSTRLSYKRKGHPPNMKWYRQGIIAANRKMGTYNEVIERSINNQFT